MTSPVLTAGRNGSARHEPQADHSHDQRRGNGWPLRLPLPAPPEGRRSPSLPPELNTSAGRQAAALVPPRGLFAEYLGYVENVTDAPALWHVGALLTVAAQALGRRVWMSWAGQRLYPHLWVALAGGRAHLRGSTVLHLSRGIVEAGGGSAVLPASFALRQWVGALGHTFGPKEAAEDIQRGRQEFATAEDARDARGQDAARGVGWGPVDDLGYWLRTFNSSCNQAAAGLLAHLYDGPGDWAQQSPTAGTYCLHRPSISLLGTAALPWLAGQGRDPAGSHDFWSRWLVVVAADKEATLALPSAPSEDQQRRVLRELSALRAAHGQRGLSAEAAALYKDWLYRVESRQQQRGGAVWLSRLGTMGLKVAMIYEAVQGDECLISAQAMELTVALMDELKTRLEQTGELSGTKADSELGRVCRALQGAGPGGTAYGELLRKLSPMGTRALRAMVQTLVDREQVRRWKGKRGEHYAWVETGSSERSERWGDGAEAEGVGEEGVA